MRYLSITWILRCIILVSCVVLIKIRTELHNNFKYLDGSTPSDDDGIHITNDPIRRDTHISDGSHITHDGESIHNRTEQLETQDETNGSSFTIPKEYDARLNLLRWKCSSPSSPSSPPSPQKKLIFVHVFKTAGSTFRDFFDSYGAACGRNVTRTGKCSNHNSPIRKSFHDRHRHAHGQRHTKKEEEKPTNCQIKKVTNNQGKTYTNYYLPKNTDIVIGHISYNMHKHWIVESKTESILPQYITFFRHPYTKYVSGIIYTNRYRKWNIQQAVKNIQHGIRKTYNNNETYNGYKIHHTTSDQKKFGLDHNINDKKWMEYCITNMIEMHTLVGIVEYMNDSLELIQSMIDVDREQTSTFESLIHPQKSNSLVKNKSELSSSQIVAILKEDEELLNMWNEILKYEFKIYEFAIQVHKLQVKELRKQHGNKYSFTS